MKKITALLFMLLIMPLSAVAAITGDALLLKEKLAQFELMNADFAQRVSSPEGKILNESWGQLTILRPGKFRWQVIMPEEELIISDGLTMWFYSPFIEQVTLINLKDAIAGTPFILLSGANEKQWENYLVIKENNQFKVTAPNDDTQNSTFIFKFDKQNNISQFAVIEEQGQRSEFTLSHKPLTAELDKNFFHFSIPEGVEIDDQR